MEGLEYPKALTSSIKIVGAVDRDVHFLWKRTNGAYGVPNKAIETWLGAKLASSLFYGLQDSFQNALASHNEMLASLLRSSSETLQR